MAHTATLLADNRTILFVGGMGLSGVLANAYAINTDSGASTSSTFPASVPGIESHAAQIVATNPSTVLVTGGDNGAYTSIYNTSLLYQ